LPPHRDSKDSLCRNFLKYVTGVPHVAEGAAAARAVGILGLQGPPPRRLQERSTTPQRAGRGAREEVISCLPSSVWLSRAAGAASSRLTEEAHGLQFRFSAARDLHHRQEVRASGSAARHAGSADVCRPRKFRSLPPPEAARCRLEWRGHCTVRQGFQVGRKPARRIRQAGVTIHRTETFRMPSPRTPDAKRCIRTAIQNCLRRHPLRRAAGPFLEHPCHSMTCWRTR
jgi:hypothetical protein